MNLDQSAPIRTLIVGAGMGGLRTAEALRRYKYQGNIHIVGDEPHMPYNRPPLSKDLLAQDQEIAQVSFPIRSDDLLAEFTLEDGVKKLSLKQQEVTLYSGEIIKFDYLVAATGLRSRKLTFENNLQLGRFALRTFDDAKKIRKAIGSGKNVVILGAGFIGLEVAATLTNLGCRVKIVAMEDIPLKLILGESFGKEVQRRHESKGIEFHLNSRISDLIGDVSVEAVSLISGETLACDVLIEAVGSEANVEWLEGNNLELSNGILTNSSLQAVRENGESVSNLFAVGDIARFPNIKYDLPARRIEHWNIPLESSKRVAREIVKQISTDSVAGFESEGGFNPLPSFWSDQFEISILSFGDLGLADENRLLEGSLEGDFAFGYFRGGSLIGVAGVGMKSTLHKLRKDIEL